MVLKSDFKPKLLNRKRVQKCLENISEVVLIILSAPMGYGKTIAVKNFLNQKKKFVSIWFTLSSSETDDDWMWKKFCKSISEVSPNIANKLYKYGLPDTYRKAEFIMFNIKNMVRRPVVIVIDDYHENVNDKFNEFLIAFTKAAIPNFHIIVISRTIPDIPIQEFELKGLCKTFYEADFEFTLEEISDFFELNGFPITNDELNLIYKNTDGWTSAVYLTLLKYAQTKNLDEYVDIQLLMKTAVYDKLDDETQQVLLKLSVFDSFTLDAAVYVTGNRKVKKLIYNLLVNNCFIKFNAKNEVYTIHSILRNVLQKILDTLNIDKLELLSKYGDWCAQNGEFIEAIKLYDESKDYVKILKIYEINGATRFINLAPKVIVHAFESIDIKLKLLHPIAYITYIFSYIIVINVEKGAKLLLEAKRIYENDKKLSNKNRILGEIAAVESFLYFNDIKLMRKYYKKAYEFFQGQKSCILSDNMMWSFGSPNILYLYYNKRGKIKSILDFWDVGKLKYYQYISNGNGIGSGCIIRAEYYLEIGNLKDAEQYANKGILEAKVKNQESIIICGNFCIARIYLLKGEFNKAISSIDKLKDYIKNIKNPHFIGSMEIAAAYIYGSVGMLSKIPSWLSIDSVDTFRQIYMKRLGIAYISIGKSAILRRNYIELEVIAENIREVCTPHNNILGFIYAGIYSSIAKYHIYGLNKAIEEFLKTCDLAQADEIVAPFVESIPEITVFLKELSNKDNNKWINKIMQAGSKFMKAYDSTHDGYTNIVLTPREESVMLLLEQGYKQYEIAEKLYISQNTVRRHLQNVYSKLGVNNKISALKKLESKNKR